MARFSGFILYKAEPIDAGNCKTAGEYIAALRSMNGTEIFEFTHLQMNPDQFDSDGYPALSKDAALLKHYLSARI